MKPIIEARAKLQQGERTDIRPKSDECSLDIFTADAQPTAPAIEPVPPIRTDSAVASLANLGKDTIRKIEQIKNEVAPEVKQWAAAGDVSINLAAQFIALPEELQPLAEYLDVHRHARAHGGDVIEGKISRYVYCHARKAGD